jgi:hypothetical protein
MLLPGCPLTDNYYIQSSSGGAGQSATPVGVSGLSGAGGAFSTGGLSDGVGGDTASGETAGDDTAGAGAVSGDTAGAADSTGGDTTLGGTGGTLSSGGSSGTGGDTTGTGGMTAGGPGAGAGGTLPSGGSGTTGGAAGAPATTGGSAGLGGSAGSTDTQYQPVCDDSVVKGGTCDGASQSCYKTCGPDSIGFKSETCERGSYVEQSGCTFPDGTDYSCYGIPLRLPAECPGTVPRASEACQISMCIVCFGGSSDNPLYEDSTGTQKEGYCVCSDAGSWTCASVSSWPCPDGSGC